MVLARVSSEFSRAAKCFLSHFLARMHAKSHVKSFVMTFDLEWQRRRTLLPLRQRVPRHQSTASGAPRSPEPASSIA
eukprot:COSAG02_NODE_737_length_17855_cov_18.729049_5_plen_77_part_00